MPIRRLFSLKPGEKFVVYWAKDDNPEHIRCNYEVQSVATNDADTILTTGGYEWRRIKCRQLDPESNILDTSRGYAYFYEHETTP